MAFLFFDKSKPRPAYIGRFASKHARDYVGRVWQAQPAWADRERMKAVYAEAQRRGCVVDHMVPLSSPHVCGLHCEANLQVLTFTENAQKSNHWWPDMWNQQVDWLTLPWELLHPQMELF